MLTLTENSKGIIAVYKAELLKVDINLPNNNSNFKRQKNKLKCI